MRSLLAFITASLLVLQLAGCNSHSRDEEDMKLSEDELYQKTQTQLSKQRYDLAVETFQALEARFPFGKYSDDAQMQIIYANFMNYDSEAAYSAADRFIRLHPQHPHVDYVYYMKGLASYTEGKGAFERFMPTDMTKRDPGAARRSFSDFSQLLTRFPNSQYAPDAQKRMIYLRNLLARYEIHVANYYFARGAILAATNRGQYVVENYEQTPAVPDALAVMVQGYHMLGYEDLANNALTVLRTNYPQYSSLDASGNFIYKTNFQNSNRSWFNRLTAGLFESNKRTGFDSRDAKTFDERLPDLAATPAIPQ